MNENKTFLSNVLLPQANNFNFLQLFLSYLVVWNHSFALSPLVNGGCGQWGGAFKPFLLNISVPCFAFITALLYINSLEKNGSLLRGLIRPFFRLYLNFLVAIFFSSVLIAPFLFNGSVLDYFYNNLHSIINYIKGNLSLNLQFHIENVLVNARNNHGINGSIWMVPLFLGFYLWASAIYGLKLRNKNKLLICTIVLFTFVVIHFCSFGKEFIPSLARPDFAYLTTFSFLFGCLLFNLKDKFEISIKKLVAVFFIFYIFKGTALHDTFKMVFILNVLLYLSSLQIPILTRFKKLFLDYKISFGIFLYSFPVQQFFSFYFPNTGPITNFALSAPTATIIAVLSKITIERGFYSLADKTYSFFFEGCYQKLGKQNSYEKYNCHGSKCLMP